jgi:hypothetical protein
MMVVKSKEQEVKTGDRVWIASSNVGVGIFRVGSNGLAPISRRDWNGIQMVLTP